MAFKDTPLWVIVSFIIVTLFGNGAYFKWREGKFQETVTIGNLQKEEATRYQEVISLTNEYVQAKLDYEKRMTPEANNKIIQLKSRLDLVKSQFVGFEERLAKLEHRAPRNIPIDFVPPAPPTNLRIVPN